MSIEENKSAEYWKEMYHRELIKSDERYEAFKKETEKNQRLVEALKCAVKVFKRMETGDFSAPMELTQIEAYQHYASSACDRIQSYMETIFSGPHFVKYFGRLEARSKEE